MRKRKCRLTDRYGYDFHGHVIGKISCACSSNIFIFHAPIQTDLILF